MKISTKLKIEYYESVMLKAKQDYMNILFSKKVAEAKHSSLEKKKGKFEKESHKRKISQYDEGLELATLAFNMAELELKKLIKTK